jgi:L-amino acid N-acyltransferase YncA
MLQIRPARHVDLGRITEIRNDVILHTAATFDTEPRTASEQEAWFNAHGERFAILVAELDGEIVGWGSLGKWSDRRAYAETAVISLYVDAEHRGKGIGTEVLETLLRTACRNGFHTVISRIAGENAASIHLHEKLGFRHIGVMQEVARKLGKLLDLCLMQKILP